MANITNKNMSNGERREQEPMSPEEVLKYMIKMGQDLTHSAQQALAMMRYAEANNIPVDMGNSGRLQKFSAPAGEYENQLIKIRGELGLIGSELLDQGIKVTSEQLTPYMEQ